MIKGEARRESSQTLKILGTLELARVEMGSGDVRDCLMTTHEDLGVVLIESALVVTNSRHVLDDDSVIGMLTLLVEDVVSLDHIVDNVRLGNFLGAELLL